MNQFQATLQHTRRVTTAVHDEMIRWTTNLLQLSGLESVDVWGRFPPEGTVRSHMVLFPYRVGPEPKSVENAYGASLMTADPYPSDKVGKIPTPYRELGRILLDAAGILFPEAGAIDTVKRGKAVPFPRVDSLPTALKDWYDQQDDDLQDPFVVTDSHGERYARPPALRWRPGISIWAHYIAVAGDPGRGVADRTSDAPPLSLPALSALTVGIQTKRVISVDLPAQPWPDELRGYVTAMHTSLGEIDTDEAKALTARLGETIPELDRTMAYDFGIIPVHDLSMHEFALLTQALQRPLQAVLNFRIQFDMGAQPVFLPSAMVSFRRARNVAESSRGGSSSGISRTR